MYRSVHMAVSVYLLANQGLEGGMRFLREHLKNRKTQLQIANHPYGKVNVNHVTANPILKQHDSNLYGI